MEFPKDVDGSCVLKRLKPAGAASSVRRHRQLEALLEVDELPR